MPLSLNIIKYPPNATIHEKQKHYDAQGGSIGRGADNDWILEDPERFLSSLHCEIKVEAGQYFLLDLSTNGTFVNGSSEPIGRGNQVQIQDGDSFEMGDYQFQASLNVAENIAQQKSNTSPFLDAPSSTSSEIYSDPFASSSTSEAKAIPNLDPLPEQTDPLAALDKADQGSLPEEQGDVFHMDSFGDSGDPLNAHIALPKATTTSNTIPEDWDFDEGDAELSDGSEEVSVDFAIPQPNPIPTPPNKSASLNKSTPSNRPDSLRHNEPVLDNEPNHDVSLKEWDALKQTNQALQDEINHLKAQLASAKSNVSQSNSGHQEASVVSADSLLIDKMQLEPRGLTAEQVGDIASLAGEFVKETVHGMMQALMIKNSFKKEFRMHIPTIQSKHNNPLMFSVNVEDALEKMFLKKGDAYQKPVAAVKDSFISLGEHQLALLAAVKNAFHHMLKGFNPDKLEEDFERYSKGGLIPGSLKTKHWDSYRQYYEMLMGDLESSFHTLFGKEFVKAYERQLQKLNAARDKKTTSTS